MPLTDAKVRALKPREKTYRISDAGGLYVEVAPNGSRYWRMKYRIAGKEKRLAFGVYPDVSLADAREKRDVAKKILAAGGDPEKLKKPRNLLRN